MRSVSSRRRRARIAQGKVTVVVKIGGSEAGRAAALAHTGSLAGNTKAFDTVARYAGVVRLDSLEDGIEAVEYLARTPLPRGERIGDNDQFRRAAQPHHGSLGADRRQACSVFRSDCAAAWPSFLTIRGSVIRSTPR